MQRLHPAIVINRIESSITNAPPAEAAAVSSSYEQIFTKGHSVGNPPEVHHKCRIGQTERGFTDPEVCIGFF